MGPCPWSSLAQGHAQFCEAAVCRVVREPANTWSNAGFLVTGIAILALDRSSPRLIRRFGLVCIFLAFGSASFHATGTRAGGLLDSAGMQATAAFVLAASLRRVLPAADRDSADRRDIRTFWLLAAAGFTSVLSFERYERMIFPAEIAAAAAVEALMLFRAPPKRAHRWVVWAWAALAPACAFWWLDVHRAFCNPSAHVVNGHAAWHLLVAAGLFCVQRFHSELATTSAPVCQMRAPPSAECERL